MMLTIQQKNSLLVAIQRDRVNDLSQCIIDDLDEVRKVISNSLGKSPKVNFVNTSTPRAWWPAQTTQKNKQGE